MHRTSEVNATLTATMQMIDALTRAGKPYDLALLPHQDHAPSGRTRPITCRRKRWYLVQHLKSEQNKRTLTTAHFKKAVRVLSSRLPASHDLNRKAHDEAAKTSSVSSRSL